MKIGTCYLLIFRYLLYPKIILKLKFLFNASFNRSYLEKSSLIFLSQYFRVQFLLCFLPLSFNLILADVNKYILRLVFTNLSKSLLFNLTH